MTKMHRLKFLVFVAFCMLTTSSCIFYNEIKYHNKNIEAVKLKSKQLEGEWKLAHIKTADSFYTPEKEIVLNFVKWGYSVLNEAPGELIIYIGTDTIKYLSYNYLPAMALDHNRLFLYRLQNAIIPETPHFPEILTKSLVEYDYKQRDKKTYLVCTFTDNSMILMLADELIITLTKKD